MNLWRVFPYDPEARAGQPFSTSHILQPQGSGRFDLGVAPVLYLAEDAEHAVAEKIARYRVARLEPNHLMEFHRQLAIVPVRLSAGAAAGILDLCDPANQAGLGIRSDELAAADPRITQPIAMRVYERGLSGLRWWSSLRGEWHTVVVFTDRVSAKQITFGRPEFLRLDHPAVIQAASVLGMRVR